jgi:hypothetical protein
MKLKWTWLLLGVALFAGLFCMTTVKNPAGRHAVSRHAIIYEDASLDEVWESAKEAIKEIGFTIRLENKDKGLLDAIAAQGPHAYTNPPLMNILIRREAGQIRVDCLMAQSSQTSNVSRDYLIQFFTELDNKLKKTGLSHQIR